MRVYRLVVCCDFSTPLCYNCSYSIGVKSRTATIKKSTPPAAYRHTDAHNHFDLNRIWGAETAALAVNQESRVPAPKSMTAAKIPVAEPSEIMPAS